MSWQVAAGEILGIIGPNGAGKSSCFAAVPHAVPRDGDLRRGITALGDVRRDQLAQAAERFGVEAERFYA